MNFKLFKQTNRGGNCICNRCGKEEYMTPKYIQSISNPVCKSCSKIKNSKVSKSDRERILQLHETGKSILEISDELKISYNSIYRTINYKPRKEQVVTGNKIIYQKIYYFCDRSPTFTVEDLLLKLGLQPKCYLTGITIDLSDANSYQLDHIIPKSRGGDNSLNNCGLLSRQVNLSKLDLTPQEFIELCKSVVNYNTTY